MVKKLLSTLALGLAISFGASAQVFTFADGDTITVNTSGQGEKTSEGYINTLDIETYVKNTTNAPIVLKWQLLSDSTEHPLGWLLTGICDNMSCRTPYSPFYFHVEQTSMPVAALGSSLMEPRVYVPVSSPNGQGIIRVKVRVTDVNDVNLQEDTLVFIINKTPVGINKITADDHRVSVYPNPATDRLQVFADKSLNPVQITVMNIAGAQQAVYNIEKGKDVTEVNVNSLAPGMYMVKVSDASNAVITTRKFVRK